MADGQKVFIALIGAAIIGAGVFYGLKTLSPGDDIIDGPKVPVSQRPTGEENLNPPDAQKPEERTQEYVNIFFIGKNENNEEVYKAVKRDYDPEVDGSKIKYAVKSLVLGPRPNEKAKGVYTEIPAGTELISVTETPDKVIINLSTKFETGGGTDSLYKRLYQLIKTARRNTVKPVYLYINGQQAEVIGGEGIMINQPLNDRSLDG